MTSRAPQTSASQTSTPRAASTPAEQTPASAAGSAPGRRLLGSGEIQSLQRAIGNQAVGRLLCGQRRRADSAPGGLLRRNPDPQAPPQADPEAPAGPEPCDPEHDSIAQILAMPPAAGERSMPEKERDLEAARTLVNRLLAQGRSTAALTDMFPLIQHRFGLRTLTWEHLGEPDARILIEINPKAYCTALGGNAFQLANQNLPRGLASKQDVTFKVGSNKHGHTWAVEMEAKQLGPNHPKGYGPSEQRNLMRPLPTNRSTHPGLENHYIRGHLLNDNLGGPGSETNLFPITEEANRRHHDDVEDLVKTWVNLEGYFVYYKVAVSNINDKVDHPKQVDSAQNYVDADFDCEAYVISASGTRADTNKYLKKTVRSRFQNLAATQNKPDAGGKTTDKADASYKSIVTKGELELSSTKDKGAKGYDEVPEDVADAINEFYLKFDAVERNPGKALTVLARKIESFTSSSQNWTKLLKITLDQDPSGSLLDSIGQGSVGTWNGLVKQIGKKKDGIFDEIDKMTDALDQYAQLTDDYERDLLAGLMGTRMSAVASKLIEDPEKAKQKFPDLYQQLEESGATDARVPRKSRNLGAFYQLGYERYEQGKTDADEGALVAKQSHDTYTLGFNDYQSGMADAEANPDSAPKTTHAAYKTAFTQYLDGIGDAQSDLAAGHQQEGLAYEAAFDTYADGVRDAEQDLAGGPKQTSAVYKSAFEDYRSGLADTRDASGARKKTTQAYTLAFDQYEQGMADAADEQSPRDQQQSAYQTALQDYDAGVADADANLNAGSQRAERAYTAAFDAYGAGLADARVDMVSGPQQDTTAYRFAFREYVQGANDARATGNSQSTNSAYAAGFSDYQAGAADARATGNSQRTDSAYTTGFDDYQDGVADARATGISAHNHQGYTEGFADYQAGVADARATGISAHNHQGYTEGFDDYQDGVADARATGVSAHNHQGYTEGFADYRAGAAAARATGVSAQNHQGYAEGFADYRAGATDAHTTGVSAQNHRAYLTGFADYRAGVQDARALRNTANNRPAYLHGYTTEQQRQRNNPSPNKRQRL